jgi:hypothetical protein
MALTLNGQQLTDAQQADIRGALGFRYDPALEERLALEGDAISAGGNAEISLTTMKALSGAGISQGFGYSTPAPGRALYVKNISIGASSLISLRLQHATTGSSWQGTGTFPSEDRAFMAGPGGSTTVDMGSFVRSGDRIGVGGFVSAFMDPSAFTTPVQSSVGNLSQGSAVISGLTVPLSKGMTVVGAGIPADTTILSSTAASATMSNTATAAGTGVALTLFGVRLTSSAKAWTLADSINFGAKKVALMFGTSLWNGTGPTTPDNCIPYLINQFYQEQGVDCRYILKAYSGSTSVGHENYRRAGKYNFQQADAVFDDLMTNDSVLGVPVGDVNTPGSFLYNLDRRVRWTKQRWPNRLHVVLGSPPLQNDTYEAARAALVSAAATYIAGLGSGHRTLFYDQGGSFNRVDANNYVSSDGAAGTRIHPGDAGFAQVWSGGYNGGTGLRSFLLANAPVF